MNLDIDAPYTLKEIKEIPLAIKEVLDNTPVTKEVAEYIQEKEPYEIYYIGCGSSYYAAYGAVQPLIFEPSKYTGRAVPASEFILYHLSKDENRKKAVLGFSRSGETGEVIEAIKKAKEKGFITIGITCTENSTITKITDRSIVIKKASENSIVMTKSYVSMQLAGILLSVLLTNLKNSKKDKIIRDAYNLPEIASKILEDESRYRSFAERDIQIEHFIFLGTTFTYSSMLEASLKFKEMTYSYTEPMYALEFRHGPIALAKRKDLTIILSILNDDSFELLIKLYQDLVKKGFQVRTISNSNNKCQTFKNPNFDIIIPWNGNKYYASLVYIIPLYLIAYYRTILKNYNPDEPENLVKVVKEF